MRRIVVGVTAACLAYAPLCWGAYAPIYGGPMYDASTQTSYPFGGALPVVPGSTAGSGVGVAFGIKHVGGTTRGTRAFRWDASGTTELEHLGISFGRTDTYVYGVNAAGISVGYAEKHVSNTDHDGERAVRWDASGKATELGHLGTDSFGHTVSGAYAINDSGMTVGFATKWTGNTAKGYRAVRWEASSTEAIELGNLGVDGEFSSSAAYAVNSAGTAVGYGTVYKSGVAKGTRAVRWDASGTVATELGNLGLANDFTASHAGAVNAAGTAVGYANKYVGGSYKGERAVRWDAGRAEATELQPLGTSTSGSSMGSAYAINDAGTAVGYSQWYDESGTNRGDRPVRWDATGDQPTPLGSLVLGSGSGAMGGRAFAINDAGFAVGYGAAWDPSVGATVRRAVLWNSDGAAIDLNALIDPASGWNLIEARDISDDFWVTGHGEFDPDGPGGLSPVERLFVLQVPEPGPGLCLFALGALSLHRRRRKPRLPVGDGPAVQERPDGERLAPLTLHVVS